MIHEILYLSSVDFWVCSGRIVGMKKLTQEEVLAKFRAVHGDRYDYSLVEYVQAHAKVAILCKDHGAFDQTPNSHWHGSGCPTCSGNYADLNTFLTKSAKNHADTYDYTKVNYVDATTKVDIICKEHGVFRQTPNKHLSGRGCPVCADNVAYNHTTFIDQCTIIHNAAYDYRSSRFTQRDEPFSFVCPTHGEQTVLARYHVLGTGCPICGIERSAQAKRKSFKEFVDRANEKHFGKYLYCEEVFVDFTTATEIICKDHGSFYQTPSEHIQGRGCRLCAPNAPRNNESFIKDATEQHNAKYDYSLVEYELSSKPVVIVCPIHGKFHQRPNTHLSGSGCPKCSEYGFKRDKKAWVYVIETNKFIGFGVTNDIDTRLSTHNNNFNKNSVIVVNIHTNVMIGEDALRIEKSIKDSFRSYILDTKIDGFRKEAVPIDKLQSLLRHIKENLPEGRLDDT